MLSLEKITDRPQGFIYHWADCGSILSLDNYIKGNLHGIHGTLQAYVIIQSIYNKFSCTAMNAVYQFIIS